MQSAYRTYHSTDTAVAYFELSVTFSKHWIVAIWQLYTLIDLSAAFDSVDHMVVLRVFIWYSLHCS